MEARRNYQRGVQAGAIRVKRPQEVIKNCELIRRFGCPHTNLANNVSQASQSTRLKIVRLRTYRLHAQMITARIWSKIEL